MLYFAYGSNMCLARLRKRVPSSVAKAVGYLARHRLVFNKPSTDGSGKGTIAFTGCDDDRVYGVVYEFADAERHLLDQAEGLGYGYNALSVPVQLPHGPIEAMTYIAILQDESLKPYHWYKAFVVQGARQNRLPPGYIKQLDAVVSTADPEPNRQAQNDAILNNG